MNKIYIVFILLINCLYCLNLNNSRMFTRHSPRDMLIILDSLKTYTQEKSKNTCGSDNDMFNSMTKSLNLGKQHIVQKMTRSIYLGWTPLNDGEIQTISEIKPLRNDNVGVHYTKIPLYFILLDMFDENKTLQVSRIIHNPSIDINMNINLMRSHLEDIVEDSDVNLCFEKLKALDNGRWLLDLFY